MENNINEQNISSFAEQQMPENFTLGNSSINPNSLAYSENTNPQQGQYMSRLAQMLMQDEPNHAFEEFNKEKPDFFKSEGRAEVLNYLKNSNAIVDKDEINTISQIVERLEQCAIERFVKQQAHEKALNYENEAAKRKLTANAQNSSFSANKNRVFTREQIGKMSGAEFTKNEPLIMEQLRKGLIR